MEKFPQGANSYLSPSQSTSRNIATSLLRLARRPARRRSGNAG